MKKWLVINVMIGGESTKIGKLQIDKTILFGAIYEVDRRCGIFNQGGLSWRKQGCMV